MSALHRSCVAALLLAACGSSNTVTTMPDAAPPGAIVAAPDTIRFLEQATFGPTEALAVDVQTQGITPYLDAQLALPSSSLGTYTPIVGQPNQFCMADGAPPNCKRDYLSPFPVAVQFMKNAIYAPDQLRHRVALALSQIVVISGVEIRPTYAIASYQQMLLDDAFANYRQVLEDVTLHPTMGRYLDMVNNDKPDAARGTTPNENYARELLQLFSIGLVKLNPDGTTALDGNGAEIPTYDQDQIEELARAFTGWTFPAAPGQNQRPHNPQYYVGRMVPVAAFHDTGKKVVLDGVTLAAGQTAEADMAKVLDTIFNHPNVGPFIGKQLIQHLVTSNPSPAYVGRITAVFNDDGSGTRGNLKAVVRAILLDPEARGDVKADASYGKLREPVLLVTGVARALGADTDGVYLTNAAAVLEQYLFAPPSVFSFYPPNATLPGSALLSPPSLLFDSTTALNRVNFVNTLVYKGVGADRSIPGATGTQATLSSFATVAGDPAALVDRFDALMLHKTMSPAMRQAILDAVAAIAATDPTGRARMAAYLVGSAAQYQVER